MNSNHEPDPDFDGHPEYSLKDKTPEEKLDYLWAMLKWKQELKEMAERSRPGRH